jgi:DNA-binding Lrp family transcriptional regulator
MTITNSDNLAEGARLEAAITTFLTSSTITSAVATINVLPAAANHFVVKASTTAVAGNNLSVTVIAQDPFNNTATSYNGAVNFASTDNGASTLLPGPSPAAHRARVGLVIQTTDVAGYVRRLAALPTVTEVETVAGEYDLIALVTAPDSAELDRVLDTVAGWRETRRTTTWVVLTRYT